jgi:hypothetical protein
VAGVPVAGLGGLRRGHDPHRRGARGRGRIRYAGADPYGGGDGGLVGVNPHVERVPLVFEGPRRDPFGVLASALLPAFYLRRKPAGHVVQAFARAAPGLLAVAEALLAAGAPNMAAAGVPLPEALPELWRWLEP